MADTNGEPHSQTLEPESNPLPLSKRKSDFESLDEGEGKREKKYQKPDIPSDPAPPIHDGAIEDDGQEEAKEEASGLNRGRNAVANKAKGVLTAVDKGKGIVVEEVEEEEEKDYDEDSDDSSDVGSGDEVGGEGDDDSEFVDDPLAELDLENILPSRARRMVPPPLGAYFDPHNEDESDGSE